LISAQSNILLAALAKIKSYATYVAQPQHKALYLEGDTVASKSAHYVDQHNALSLARNALGSKAHFVYQHNASYLTNHLDPNRRPPFVGSKTMQRM
jgi:hypothetical protein